MTTPIAQLSSRARRELLALARKAIESYLKDGKMHHAWTSNPELCSSSGAFVSLHRGKELRGCIGQLQSDKELFHTVQHCAVCAATEDSRFPPVRLDELGELTLEISVLTPFQRVENFDQVEVGRHGLYLVGKGCRGLLLPQVARQYGWDRETFLSQTCRKAGLPDAAWQDPASEIYIFEAQVFSEGD